MTPARLQGAGLGFRRALLGPLEAEACLPVDFMEIAPENWIDVGGRPGRRFRAATERCAFVCHGLSLNIGGPAPLDEPFLVRLRRFLDEHGIGIYTEHLSWCADDGQLYDLLPIPFTDEAVRHVADRVRTVQDVLGRRIALENVSYYAAPGQALAEIDFVNAVLEEADCDLLLDVNNVYVNSVNHRYDPVEYIEALPGHRIVYGHIAGHYREAEDLLVDTHGAAVIDPVWRLLETAYTMHGVFPTLLERDFNFPPLATLLDEVRAIAATQARVAGAAPAAARG